MYKLYISGVYCFCVITTLSSFPLADNSLHLTAVHAVLLQLVMCLELNKPLLFHWWNS